MALVICDSVCAWVCVHIWINCQRYLENHTAPYVERDNRCGKSDFYVLWWSILLQFSFTMIYIPRVCEVIQEKYYIERVERNRRNVWNIRRLFSSFNVNRLTYWGWKSWYRQYITNVSENRRERSISNVFMHLYLHVNRFYVKRYETAAGEWCKKYIAYSYI